MNRKGACGQNDISIIIGNLPKRLQRKIAEEIAEASTADDNDGPKSMVKHAVNAEVKRVATEAAAAVCSPEAVSTALSPELPIDFFLRRSGNTLPEEPAATVPLSVTAPAEVTTKLEPIPGILRLSATDTSKLSTVVGRNVGAVSRENGRRPRAQRNEVTMRADLPISPLHQSRVRGNDAVARTPHWFDSLDASYAKELSPLYERLTLMMQNSVVLEKWQTFCALRAELQQVFAQLLLQHLKFCCEHKVDTFFWKLLFYNVREYLKMQHSEQAPDRIHELINIGLQFYTNLHAELCAKYLNALAGGEGPSHKYSFIAKVAAQKLLICLGDLSRYKIKQLQLQDYTEAANYYQRAQYLIPSNGIPYNQLAVVAIHARKKFDAVYFHMRSLMSSNAIHSARESLSVLFDEIRKKYEETEIKISPLHQHHNNTSGNSNSMRKEVWIRPDGVRRLHRTDLNGVSKSTIREENRYDEMPADELLRRFTSLYLYIIGKLYTGIGMESIQEHQRKLLVILNVVLKRNLFARSRLLKMVALNIFVMEQNVHKATRREIRYQAFNFCNQMFGLVLRKSNQLLTLGAGSTNEFKESLADINTLLQFVKIYTDWLTQNVLIWEPVRSEEHSFSNCWTELELLFPKLLHAQAQTSDSVKEPVTMLCLDEDNYLVGFTPLSATLAKHYEPQRSNEILQFHRRSMKIVNFQQCYEANRKRLVAPEESHFILEELNTVIKTALDNLKDDYDNNSENIVSNGVVGGLIKSKSATDLKLTNTANDEDVAQMSQLSKLKKELEAKTNVKKMYNAKLEQILKYVDTKFYIEVRPKYLLPDTNCFIDCLDDFERLSQEFKRYTLVIPLTVVKELDGLSKGVKLESLQKNRIHHFDDVSTCAKKSLDFIKTAKNNVKCATTKGSIINASLFALVEEEHVSNDDKILATAMALSKTMSSETCSDGKCFIQTELVLITTDRNLRVKALSRNLAVSELSEFVQWAKDCNT